MKKVLIESPYAAQEHVSLPRDEQVRRHLLYARAALRASLVAGEAPLASHLLYTQDNVLDDEIAVERALGIEAGLVWQPYAELVAVYIDYGVSPGMRQGIAAAHEAGVPVEFRRLSVHRDHYVVDTSVNSTESRITHG